MASVVLLFQHDISFYLDNVPVNGMLGMVNVNWYTILQVPLFHCLFMLPDSYFYSPIHFPNAGQVALLAGNSIGNFSPLQGVPPSLHCGSKYPKITVSFWFTKRVGGSLTE